MSVTGGANWGRFAKNKPAPDISLRWFISRFGLCFAMAILVDTKAPGWAIWGLHTS